MAKKELRTVKKSSQTGRLNRAEVRSAVVAVRDGEIAHSKSGSTKGSRGPAPASSIRTQAGARAKPVAGRAK